LDFTYFSIWGKWFVLVGFHAVLPENRAAVRREKVQDRFARPAGGVSAPVRQAQTRKTFFSSWFIAHGIAEYNKRPQQIGSATKKQNS